MKPIHRIIDIQTTWENSVSRPNCKSKVPFYGRDEILTLIYAATRQAFYTHGKHVRISCATFDTMLVALKNQSKTASAFISTKSRCLDVCAARLNESSEIFFKIS